MNFYKHHLGDYDGATAHLSWDEDMAYTRLLRAYYRSEKPIPCDQAYRLARANSRAQRAAVDSVLREFFKQQGDCWHNKRADEEIATFHEEGEEGAAKKENERERQKRHRKRRKELFAALRERDIVPKFDTSNEELQRLLETDASRSQQRDDNAHVTRTATAIHKPEPLTKNQNQEPETSKSTPLARGDKSPSHGEPVNGNAVAYIPLVGGAEFGVSKELLAELEGAYPQVDVPQTLKEIRVWCVANPAKRKTARGAARFINRWCERVQNGG